MLINDVTVRLLQQGEARATKLLTEKKDELHRVRTFLFPFLLYISQVPFSLS